MLVREQRPSALKAFHGRKGARMNHECTANYITSGDHVTLYGNVGEGLYLSATGRPRSRGS